MPTTYILTNGVEPGLLQGPPRHQSISRSCRSHTHQRAQWHQLSVDHSLPPGSVRSKTNASLQSKFLTRSRGPKAHERTHQKLDLAERAHQKLDLAERVSWLTGNQFLTLSRGPKAHETAHQKLDLAERVSCLERDRLFSSKSPQNCHPERRLSRFYARAGVEGPATKSVPHRISAAFWRESSTIGRLNARQAPSIRR